MRRALETTSSRAKREVQRAEVVSWIASRVDEPEALLQGAFRRDNETVFAITSYELSTVRGLNGFGGAALLHGIAGAGVCRGGPRSHSFLVSAVNGPLADVTLSSGWAGMAVVAQVLANGTRAYARVRERISELLASEIGEFVDRRDLTHSEQYELLRGYAGLYLSLEGDCGAAASAILVDLFDWLTADRARWRLPHGHDDLFPEPLNRLGVSHGIAGILGALCCRPEVPGAIGVIRHVTNVLLEAGQRTAFGTQWPYAEQMPLDYELRSFRAAWCHYTLGIAAVLAAAARVLEDQSILRVVEEATVGLLELDESAWGLFDASLCHGTSGSAALLRYLAIHTKNASLRRKSDQLVDRTIDLFNPHLPFGVEVVWPNSRWLSDGSFLMGATGIGVALASLGEVADLGWLKLLGVPPVPRAEAPTGRDGYSHDTRYA